MRALIIACLSILILNTVTAETWVNKLFSDGMVVQRNAEIKVWGTDNAGQEVMVSLNGKSAKATAADDGSWSLQLPAMEAGGPFELVIKGSSEKTIKDVLIGEVWLCSGQSNMAFPLDWLKGPKENVLSDTKPQLRMFKVEKDAGGEKAKDIKGKWSNANGNISKWSGTAYHFGKFLHQHLKVPVGLINSSVGGTPVESWTDHAVLDTIPSIKGHIGWLNKQVKTGKWKPDNPWRPASLYNRMIHPLLGYTIKGAIWYQGESNAGRGKEYSETFKKMITDWRKQWDIGDFPFITVQLANHIPKNHKKKPTAWADVREAQNDSLALPNTGIAVSIDIGDPKDIHPKNKNDVGYRLFLNARKLAYNEDLVYSGPLYKSKNIKGTTVVITFNHTADGLKAKGDLTGWEIAGSDKKYVAAKATIKGDTVVVSADGVAKPEFVRYGWNNNPACNLYNSADLPASPFRTDK